MKRVATAELPFKHGGVRLADAKRDERTDIAEHGRFDPQSNPEGWLTYAKPLAEVYNTLIVHHSALLVSDGPLEIQRLHRQSKGYADIGYHFLINERGGVSVGRVIQARGAHTGGFNTGTVGVVLLGNFESIQPTDLQLRALQS